MSDNVPATSFTSWRFMPNEMKAHVAKYMDLSSALSLKRCGAESNDIVQAFCCFDVILEIVCKTQGVMIIRLIDSETLDLAQQWSIKDCGLTSFMWQYGPQREVLNYGPKRTTMARTAFTILGELLGDKMFNIKSLKFGLTNFIGPVNLHLSEIVDVDLIIIEEGTHRYTIRSIIENPMIETQQWIVMFENNKNCQWIHKLMQKNVKTRELTDLQIQGEEILANGYLFCPADKVEEFESYMLP